MLTSISSSFNFSYKLTLRLVKKIIETGKLKAINFVNKKSFKPRAYNSILYCLNLPIVSQVYKSIYLPQIYRKSKKKPNTIVIEPYNVCNLACTMCPYPDLTRPTEQMSMQLFEKVIDDAVNNNFKRLSLSLYNEPYMDSLVFDRIKLAKKKGLETEITTNATLLTEELIQKTMSSGVDCVTFSIDSLDEKKYESIRVNASFKKTISNVKKMIAYRMQLNQKKPMLTMAAVLHGNDNSLNDMEDRLKGLDIYAVSMRDNRKDGQPTPGHLKAYPCFWPWNQLVVYSSGEIALCCVDSDNAHDLGDLKTQTINEVWESKVFKNLRKLLLTGQGDQIEICKDCDIPYRQSPVLWWAL